MDSERVEQTIKSETSCYNHLKSKLKYILGGLSGRLHIQSEIIEFKQIIRLIDLNAIRVHQLDILNDHVHT